MTDTIIKGTGNSRTLVSVPNFLTLYPSWEDFGREIATNGIPIDLLGLNPAGVDVLGTLLNKPNLLSDATETSIWGSAANRTVNAALAQLRTLITTAENTANGRLQYQTGNYDGDGILVRTLNFSFTPQLVVISALSGAVAFTGLFINPAPYGLTLRASTLYAVQLNWTTNSVSWSGSDVGSILNNSVWKYSYTAIG